MNFSEFKLDARILSNVDNLGYKSPTPIQSKTIPLILKNADVIGLAQTGTGKTAAFLLPLLQKLLDGPKAQLRALVIVPTRELAEQIHDSFCQLASKTGLKSTTLYGGVNLIKQSKQLQRGVDLVIACPGRLLDHINRNNINLSQTEIFVLDEADQMFDFGFFPTIRKILQYLPNKKQSLLFSATMPKAIRLLAEEILKNPVSVQIGELLPAQTVKQILYPVTEGLKTELLVKIIQVNDMDSVLIFTRTKHRAKQLAAHLESFGYSATSFQGNLSQSRRQIALNQFRTKKLKFLVATDIAARGIDIDSVSHVINFDMPATTESYTHRIGRTGRASKLGAAFTLITHSDQYQVRAIERKLKQSLEKCIIPDFNYKITAYNNPVTTMTGGIERKKRGKFITPQTNFNSKKHINFSGKTKGNSEISSTSNTFNKKNAPFRKKYTKFKRNAGQKS